MKKTQRLIKMREIISTYVIETQDELVRKFNELGYPVTQATISRDIKELQLVKVPTDKGTYKYSLPIKPTGNPSEKLSRALADNLVTIDQANYFIVLKTLPGNAQSVGALIDQLDWQEMMGSICGDDTCLIICRSEDDREQVYRRFMGMLN